MGQLKDEHLGLPFAAALVYSETVAPPPVTPAPAELRDILDDVAHAMSNVMPIYAADPASGEPREIPVTDLLDAIFHNGARLLVTAHGKEYRGLSILRSDLEEGITLLKRARFGIRGRPSSSGLR